MNTNIKNQNGSAATAFISIFVILIIAGIILFQQYITAHDNGARFENQIKAVWENNENILGQYSLKVKEAAKVSDKYTEALSKVVTDAMSGRYGEDGSEAVFQWIQEQNPTVDASVFKEIQQLIIAGRNKFEVAQTQLIDVKQTYQNQLDFFWSGMWLEMAGYPKLSLDDYKAITSEHAQETFKTGVDKGVDF